MCVYMFSWFDLRKRDMIMIDGASMCVCLNICFLWSFLCNVCGFENKEKGLSSNLVDGMKSWFLTKYSQ